MRTAEEKLRTTEIYWVTFSFFLSSLLLNVTAFPISPQVTMYSPPAVSPPHTHAHTCTDMHTHARTSLLSSPWMCLWLQLHVVVNCNLNAMLFSGDLTGSLVLILSATNSALTHSFVDIAEAERDNICKFTALSILRISDLDCISQL